MRNGLGVQMSVTLENERNNVCTVHVCVAIPPGAVRVRATSLQACSVDLGGGNRGRTSQEGSTTRQ
jgi:hypothetical protein